jgi:probable rRNA maturation factor
MTCDVEVLDRAGCGLCCQAVVDVVSKVMDAEGIRGLVSVVTVDEATITRLNARYRDLPDATDVLSFAEESGEAVWSGPDPRRSLGEIVVCPEVVARYAEEDGVPYAHQLGWSLVHGALHLLGYDHECDQGQMRARESELVKQCREDFARLSRPDTY